MLKKTKTDENYKTCRAGWHEELGAFYVQTKVKRKWVFVEPLEKMTIQGMDRTLRAEFLQMVFMQKYGYINPQIGFFKNYDEQLAKELDVF